MLNSYLIIAYRNLLKNKVFSLINILGLTLGIVCCTLLALFVQDEFSYEKHFDGYDRIYRITTTVKQESGPLETFQRTSPPIAMAIRETFPEVEAATRIVNPPEVEQHLIQHGANTFYEKKGYLVDSSFLSVFSFELREGNPSTALAERSSVILSHELAEKLFDNESALNAMLIITSGFSVDTFRVTGVLKPMVKKSHVNADFYISMNSKGWGDLINGMTTWSGQNFIFSYLKLKPGASSEELVSKVAPLLEKHGGEELRAMKRHKVLGLQPLKDVHLYSSHFAYNFDLSTNGSIYYIYVMTSVALFILLIACINFMNLATAKATQRASEVGVRKTMGATRNDLIRQFLGESIIIVMVAMVLAVGMLQIALPIFNSLTNRSLFISVENSVFFFGFMVTIALITGTIAGSYPAFFLSSLQPVQVLKSKVLPVGSSQWIRKGLVVAQFVIAITLISSSLVILKQLRFIPNQSLGYDKEYKLMIPLRTPEARTSYQNLKGEILNITGIKAVSATTSLPSTPLLRDFTIYSEGNDMRSSVHHFIANVDEGYFNLLDVPVVLGRELQFETDAASNARDRNRILVNRISLKKLGIAEDNAIGSILRWSGKVPGQDNETTFEYEIIGVVENFHFASLHNPIEPVAFFLPESRDFLFLAISVDAGSFRQAKSQIEALWKKHVPATPFESQFLSDSVAKQYESDHQISKIIILFTGIAIVISCLGLYGLSVYVTERRIKEIGIRKVLGASTSGIVKMLTKEFIILVAVAFLIAIPIGYNAMERWLQNFAYKTELNIFSFLIAGGISFMIAWLTVGFQSIRAATINPASSLKND